MLFSNMDASIVFSIIIVPNKGPRIDACSSVVAVCGNGKTVTAQDPRARPHEIQFMHVPVHARSNISFTVQ